MSAGSAWALLADLAGARVDWLHPSALSRLRRLERDAGRLVAALGAGAPRARVLRLSVPPVDLARIREEGRLVPTGLSALGPGIDFVSNWAGLDAYVHAERVAEIERKWRPESAPHAANLVLRVPSHRWILSLTAAPLSVAAADLMDGDDPAATAAARAALLGLSAAPRPRRRLPRAAQAPVRRTALVTIEPEID